MGKIFAVTSGKGGVGKSSFAALLAKAFANSGSTVLLVDADEGFRCLDLMLGVDSQTVFDLSDVAGKVSIESAVYPCGDGLFLVPAPNEKGKVSGADFAYFLDIAEKTYDIIIVDFGAGYSGNLYEAMPVSTLFLAVTLPSAVALRDVAAIGGRLESLGFEARLIINRFCAKKHKKQIDEIIDNASIRLLGIVPDSRDIERFADKHTIKQNSAAAKAIMRIAKRLSGEKVLLPDYKKI